MSKPQPPECPNCGCNWAPMVEHRTIGKKGKEKLLLKHRCRHCGRAFTRKVELKDAKIYGVPGNDIETSDN
ncbi:MAG TPA: hypothetical protein VMW15_14710 [Terracidiphilus sp.]|nr:hypothetical protein [Terracidiphilus sp.]